YHTNLVLKEIKRTSDMVSKFTGMTVPGNKAVVGRNAFAHESGIHQDGVLKNAETYEIITPELVGVQSNNLVLGKHSGRHAFTDKIKQLGYQLSDEKLKKAFVAFKALTDQKKEVTDDDLFAILTDIQTDTSNAKRYTLDGFKVKYDTSEKPSATITLTTPDDKQIEQTDTGQGSVDALYHTLDNMIREETHLTDFQLNSIGQGRDALAEVHVSLIVDKIEVSGRGSAQDVLEAAVLAYLNGVNRAIYQKRVNATVK